MIIIFLTGGWHDNGFCEASGQDRLKQARQLFYDSVENSRSVERAILLFRQIGAEDSLKRGLALTYIGALTALKGKFAFFPLTKYRRATRGIDLMDQGVAMDPDQIESRFIRGMTCYYMPFFFHRKDTAINDFQMLIRRLETEYMNHDSGIVRNILDFMLENMELTGEEIDIIRGIQYRMDHAE